MRVGPGAASQDILRKRREGCAQFLGQDDRDRPRAPADGQYWQRERNTAVLSVSLRPTILLYFAAAAEINSVAEQRNGEKQPVSSPPEDTAMAAPLSGSMSWRRRGRPEPARRPP